MFYSFCVRDINSLFKNSTRRARLSRRCRQNGRNAAAYQEVFVVRVTRLRNERKKTNAFLRESPRTATTTTTTTAAASSAPIGFRHSRINADLENIGGGRAPPANTRTPTIHSMESLLHDQLLFRC